MRTEDIKSVKLTKEEEKACSDVYDQALKENYARNLGESAALKYGFQGAALYYRMWRWKYLTYGFLIAVMFFIATALLLLIFNHE